METPLDHLKTLLAIADAGQAKQIAEYTWASLTDAVEAVDASNETAMLALVWTCSCAMAGDHLPDAIRDGLRLGFLGAVTGQFMADNAAHRQ